MTWPLHHGVVIKTLDPRAQLIVHLIDGGAAVTDRLETLIDQRPPWFVEGARARALAVYGIDMNRCSDQVVIDLIPRYIRDL